MSDDENLITLFNYLRDIIYFSDKEYLNLESLGAKFKDLGEGLVFLHTCIKEQKALGYNICIGNLNCQMPSVENVISAPLKAVHGQLCHVNWLMKQVTDGNLKQRLRNMGEVSATFNKMIDKLLVDANQDDITGLSNRKSFEENTRNLIASNPNKQYYLIRWDLTGFKIFNDIFGSDVGSNLLRHIADFVRDTFGDDCTSCRYNSDHFIVCFPEERYDLSETIYKIRHCYRGFGADFRYRTTLGICKITDYDTKINTLCERALYALQTVKHSNKINYAFYEESFRLRLLKTQHIVNKMKKALADREFEVFFQPQYSAESYEIVGAEALVRWRQADGTFILPSDFIPIFENNGFITQLDEFVWEETSKVISKQIASYGADKVIPLSVNISRVDLQMPNIKKRLDSLIEKYGLERRMLRLEITESAYVDESDSLLPVINQLKSSGYTLEMDDFGSGYSSLNTLKDVEVDIIKLDLKFLRSTSNQERGNNILSSVVRMAKWLCLPIIAEGVETLEQLELLKNLGCEYIQGYYFAKPMPTKEFEELIAKRFSAYAVNPNDTNKIDEAMAYFKVKEQYYYRKMANDKIGVGIIEYTNGNIEAITVNDSLLEFIGITREEYNKCQYNILQRINALDRAKYIAMYKRAMTSEAEEECIVHSSSLIDWKIVSINTKCKLIAKNGVSYLFYIESEPIPQSKDNESLLIENALLRARLEEAENKCDKERN